MWGAGFGFSFFGLRFSRLPCCSLLAIARLHPGLSRNHSTFAPKRGGKTPRIALGLILRLPSRESGECGSQFQLDGPHALPAGAAIERCSGRGFLHLREHDEGFPSPKSGWLRMAKPLRGAQGQPWQGAFFPTVFAQDNLRQGRALPTRCEKKKPRANRLARAGSQWGCADLARRKRRRKGAMGCESMIRQPIIAAESIRGRCPR